MSREWPLTTWVFSLLTALFNSHKPWQKREYRDRYSAGRPEARSGTTIEARAAFAHPSRADDVAARGARLASSAFKALPGPFMSLARRRRPRTDCPRYHAGRADYFDSLLAICAGSTGAVAPTHRVPPSAASRQDPIGRSRSLILAGRPGEIEIGGRSRAGDRLRRPACDLSFEPRPVDPRQARRESKSSASTSMISWAIRPAVAAAWQGHGTAPAATALKALLASLPRERTIVHVHGWAKRSRLRSSVPLGLRSAGALYDPRVLPLLPQRGFYDYLKSAVCKLKPMSLSFASRLIATRETIRTRSGASVACFAGADAPADAERNSRTTSASPTIRPTLFAPYIPQGRDHPSSIESDRGVRPGAETKPSSGEFVFVGRLSPEKGASLFAEAAARAGSRRHSSAMGRSRTNCAPSTRRPLSRVVAARKGAPRDAGGPRAGFPSLWYEGQPLDGSGGQSDGHSVIVSDVCAAVRRSRMASADFVQERRRRRACAGARASQGTPLSSQHVERRLRGLLAKSADARRAYHRIDGDLPRHARRPPPPAVGRDARYERRAFENECGQGERFVSASTPAAIRDHEVSGP